MWNNENRKYVIEALKQHEQFIVIGLTGRVGSGCSEVAHILSSSFDKIGLPPIYPGNLGIPNDQERDRRILFRYAAHHWLRFDVIRVRAVITVFLLKDLNSFCQEVQKDAGIENFERKLLENTTEALRKYTQSKFEKQITNQFKKVSKVVAQMDTDNSKPIDDLKNNEEDEEAQEETQSDEEKTVADIIAVEDFHVTWDDCKAELKDYITSWNVDQEELIDERQRLSKLRELFEKLYKFAERPEYYNCRVKILKEVDSLLEVLSAWTGAHLWTNKIINFNQESIAEEKSENRKKNNVLETLGIISDSLINWKKADSLDFSKYVIVQSVIPTISDVIHEVISEKKGSVFTELYQKYGNCIRRYGRVLFNETEVANSANRTDIFSIPRLINQFIKSIRHPFDRSFARPTRIVIDSIKSVHEATYLRERYSAFYLFAISSEEDVRRKRLTSSNGKNLTERDIRCIDWTEYPSYGAEILQRFLDEYERNKASENDYADQLKRYEEQGQFTADEVFFIKKVLGKEYADEHYLDDSVRREAYQKKLFQFVLQDVGVSIQNADVFISNNHDQVTMNIDLRWEIVRNISLIMHPGLLLPTTIERCMQAAFTAKANSGCLSRQVGAIVTDAEYNILSIGWNDVPCGDISCSRKNLADLYREQDQKAYTKFETTNSNFRDRIEKIYSKSVNSVNGDMEKLLVGLPWRYCFKDIHMEGKHPMRSRAMHAEEKALASVQESAAGGYLFTTSSPCEMCSKNAKNHRIKKIYYIEPYPGISEEQYSDSGDENNRAKHVLFTGAIGRAYTQMYSPIMPHKDILEFLGVQNNISKTSTDDSEQ